MTRRTYWRQQLADRIWQTHHVLNIKGWDAEDHSSILWCGTGTDRRRMQPWFFRKEKLPRLCLWRWNWTGRRHGVGCFFLMRATMTDRMAVTGRRGWWWQAWYAVTNRAELLGGGWACHGVGMPIISQSSQRLTPFLVALDKQKLGTQYSGALENHYSGTTKREHYTTSGSPWQTCVCPGAENFIVNNRRAGQLCHASWRRQKAGTSPGRTNHQAWWMQAKTVNIPTF